MHRRRLVASSAALLMGGCLSSGTVRLGGVRVENFRDDERTVEIRVEDTGTTIHETTVTVSPASDAPSTHIIECQWRTDDQRGYSVAARSENREEWSEITLTNENGSCQWIAVQLEADDPFIATRDCKNHSETPCELVEG